MFRPYREILSRPGALAFSAAGVVARLPMSMVGIGIVLMVSALYDSYGLAGRVSALYVIFQAACSPQLARLVDRLGQARVMRPAIAVSAVGIVGLVGAGALHAPPACLYVAAAVTGATIGSFGALVRARWSHLLDDARQIHTAYSLESALDELVFIVGPVLATLLATGVQPTAGLVVPVIAMVAGGYWFLAQRATQPPARGVGPGDARGSVLRSRGMVVLALVFIGMGSIFGATDVSTVAFAQEKGSKGSAGAILAVFALGSMISGLGYGMRHWLSPLWKRFAVGVVALAAGVSLFFLVDSLAALAAVMFITGFAIAPTIINGNGLVQHFVAPNRLTEGLTWVGTSLGIGVSVGSSVAGYLIDGRGSPGGFLVVVGSAVFAVAATLVSLRTLRAGTASLRRSRPHPPHSATEPSEGPARSREAQAQP
jgi:MFS family permease